MAFNAFGLNRSIPAEIKRLVRQRCGFGCVICGFGVVQYEHVDPEFKDAKRHDPDTIALLCPQCHAKVTTGMWSKARVKLAMKSPKCHQLGYAREFFDLVVGHPEIQFGGVLLKNCPVPIEVRGLPLFSIKPAENPGEPFLLSGYFTDSKGEVSLVIQDNEWRAEANLWDVEVKGPRITIREAQRATHLVLRVDPPNALIVERLDMLLAGIRFEANGDFLRVTYPDGSGGEFTSCLSDNCAVGLALG